LERLFNGDLDGLSLSVGDNASDGYETDWGRWELLVERNPELDEDDLLGAIMTEEAQRLTRDGRFSGIDLVDRLASILDEVYVFLSWDENEAAEYLEEGQSPLSWFLDTISEGSHILVVDSTGHSVFDSSGAALGSGLPRDLLESSTEIHDWRNGQVVCAVVVAAGEGHYREEAAAFLDRVVAALYQGAWITLAITLLFALWFARRVLAPVRALTSASQSLARGQRSERLPVTSKDEVGTMSQSFNDMLDAIELQQEQRKQMVADLAHELNTPLSVIRLELAGLEANMQEPAECIQHIEGELQVLTRLAADVALLAGADRGELSLDLQDVDLPSCCARAVARWQSRAAAASLELNYVGASELPTVQADELRISQVLGNLISNAIRHTAASGSITIDASVSSGPTENGERSSAVTISVSDTGEGIPADQLDRIFERFTRLDSARSRQSGGSGLGLAIVADIVHRHGGKVWAESAAEQGCTIRFRLPR
jgi:signal transduction histidine kinase